MVKVLFVCLGNICRSPLAQGVFETKVKQLGYHDKFYADSAGTSAWHEGEKPDRRSIEIGKKYNVNIENQRSRPVSFSDRTEFDYIIAMDDQNVYALTQEFGVPEEKILKLRFFDPEQKNGNVPDPYNDRIDGFDRVYQIIDRSMTPFIDFLANTHKL